MLWVAVPEGIEDGVLKISVMKSRYNLNHSRLDSSHLAQVIGGNASHVVMNGRKDRDWLLGHVNTSKNGSGFRDARQPLCEHLLEGNRNTQTELEEI